MKIYRSKRKSISLSVDDMGEITIRSPEYTTKKSILNFVKQNKDWIISQKNRKANFKKKWLEGEKHLLMGRKRRLKVIPSYRESVSHDEEYIIFFSKENYNEKNKPFYLKEQLRKYYRELAQPVFQEIFMREYPRLRLNKPAPNITLKWMRTRWGSCSSRPHLNLNIELIQFSPRIIELVICHEICHLIHMNHSKDFYQKLAELLPDHRSREKELQELSKKIFLSGG